MWVFIAAAIPVIGIVYSGFALWCVCTFRRRSDERPASSFTPPVSILKPLCGLDPHGYDSLRSHCVQDYPAFEIIFGVSDPDDGVIPVIERLIREFPAIRLKLVQCPRVLGSNLKVSNLNQMWAAAGNYFLGINNSDISVPVDYLRHVIAPLEDASVGMVTCLYRGIAGPTIGSKLEALGISSDFMPGVLCANRIEGRIRFALGSTLAFSRRVLTALGGLEPLADFLADDYQMGYRTAQAGLRVELAGCVVDHWLPSYTFTQFVQHQLRWARAIRSSRPDGYAGLIFTFVIPWSLLTLVITGGAGWAWMLFGAAVVLRYAIALISQRRVLDDSRGWGDWWLLAFRAIVGLLIWICCYAGRHVVWRGKRFVVDHGKLRPSR